MKLGKREKPSKDKFASIKIKINIEITQIRTNFSNEYKYR